MWSCILVRWRSSKFLNWFNPHCLLPPSQLSIATMQQFTTMGVPAPHTSTRGNCLTVASGSEWSVCLRTQAEWLVFQYPRYSLHRDQTENTVPLLMWVSWSHVPLLQKCLLGLGHVATLTPAALILSHDTATTYVCWADPLQQPSPWLHYFTSQVSWHNIHIHETETSGKTDPWPIPTFYLHTRNMCTKDKSTIGWTYSCEKNNSDKIQHFDNHWDAGCYWPLSSFF